MVLAAAVLAAVITAGAAPATAQAKTNRTNGSGQPWRNPGQPPGVRASELLAALNTDQKIQLALGNFAALKSFGVPVLKADDATGQRPLFPFGYGLSYQRFAVSGVSAAYDRTARSATVLVGTSSADLGHAATFRAG